MQVKHRKKILSISTRAIESKNGIYTELYVDYKISMKSYYSLCKIINYKN